MAGALGATSPRPSSFLFRDLGFEGLVDRLLGASRLCSTRGVDRGFESLLLRFTHGEVSEWPKERDWKSRTC
jgi:hypothetical protein